MNRKKLKQSLLLLNLIVLIGLVVFYPTEAAGYTYSSEFERTVNRFISTRQWADIWAIFIISLLSTSSIYLFITAFNDKKNEVIPSRDDLKRHQ